MVHYIGVDIVEISRIRQAIARWGDRFLRRVFTRQEIDLYARKPHSLAARLAGKEAVNKALQKPAGASWQHIEILSDAAGQPVVRLYGKAGEQAARLGLEQLTISLAHSREYAIALVIGVPR